MCVQDHAYFEIEILRFSNRAFLLDKFWYNIEHGGLMSCSLAQATTSAFLHVLLASHGGMPPPAEYITAVYLTYNSERTAAYDCF